MSKQNPSFWSEQPIIHSDNKPDRYGPLEKPQKISKTPIDLPEGFEWRVVNIKNPSSLKQLVEFLSDNYVEDSEEKYRLIYSPELLLWALLTTDNSKELHVAIIEEKNPALKNKEISNKTKILTAEEKIVGFISATPTLFSHKVPDDNAENRMNQKVDSSKKKSSPINKSSLEKGEEKEVTLLSCLNELAFPSNLKKLLAKSVDVNFLCVEKKNRSKSLAKVLIREITRRAYIMGVFQSVFTGPKDITTPLAELNYYHRPIKSKKLHRLGFLPSEWPVESLEFFNTRSSEEETGVSLTETVREDIDELFSLRKETGKGYLFDKEYTREEFEHTFCPASFFQREDIRNLLEEFYRGRDQDRRPKIVGMTFKRDGMIKGYVLFYMIHNLVIVSDKIKGVKESEMIKTLFVLNVECGLEDKKIIMEKVFEWAEKEELDVVNCLDNLYSERELSKLKFLKGDGVLKYFVFNWMYKKIEGRTLRYEMF